MRSRAEALWILLNRSGMTSNKGVDLIMERLAPDAALTPEYVSGWLAGREAAAKDLCEDAQRNRTYQHETHDAEEAHKQGLYALAREESAVSIGRLAPPSAPPVQQIEARVQELLHVIHEEHADPPGCNCVYCEEYRRGRSDRLDAVTICDAPSVIEDRMLLLKALLGGDAQRTGPDELIVYTGGRSPPPRFRPTLDSEGFPILTDELRSALIKATEAK